MIVNSEQMRRLEALEREARLRRMEADLDNIPPDVVAIAERFDPGFEVYKQTMREAYQRVEEIGKEAYLAETAAECNCTVEELLSGELKVRLDREMAEWEEQDRARRAEVITWRGGTPPVPYRNGEPLTDGPAGSWR